jgi:uncharacterized protein YeaO (DUF488 family)
MNANYILFGFLFICMTLTFDSSAKNDDGSIEETPSAREAVRLVEKQKILSQKATKAFMGLVVNNKVPDFYQELDSSRIFFEQYMRQIELFAPGTPLETSSKNVRESWNAFSEQTQKEIDKEEAKILLELNDALLSQIQDLSIAARNYAQDLLPEVASSLKQVDALTYQTYDQNVLLQEYMLYFYTKKAGVSLRGLNKRFKTVEEDIENNLKKLMDATENSAEVDQLLHLSNTHWKEVKAHLQNWNAEDRSYVSTLCLYTRWTNEKLLAAARQYQEISEIMSISHLINLASAHRAHSQALAKQYISIAYGLGNAVANKRDIQNSVEQFESRMERLELFAPTESILMSTRTVKGFWKNYKKLLITEYSEANVFKLLEQSYIIMAACDEVAEQIEKYAEGIKSFAKLQQEYDMAQKVSHLVNLSGRQCMDLQRIPIYFVLLSKEMGGNMTNRRYEEAHSQFNNTLQTLKDASINTPEMEEMLVEIQELWDPLKNGIMGTVNNQDNTRLTEAIKQSDLIYEKMQKISLLYAKEMNDLIERKLRN